MRKQNEKQWSGRERDLRKECLVLQPGGNSTLLLTLSGHEYVSSRVTEVRI